MGKDREMNGLLKSRKFWLLVLDTVVSIVTYAAAHYLSPEAVDMVRFLIITMQPVFVMLIGSIAYEDAASKRAGMDVGPSAEN